MTAKTSAKGIALLPPPLDKLPDFDKTLLKQTGVLRTVPKGDTIMKPGEQSTFVYYLHTGWCSVSIEGYIAELLSPGSAFMVSVTETAPAWAEVVTLSKATMICIELRTLRAVMERHPWLATLFLETALRRLARAHIFYALKGSQPLEQRLADVLWHVGTPDESGSRLVPSSLTQAVLASLLGAPREEVNRKRQLLVKTGYLYEVDGQWHMDAMTPVLLANMPASLTAQSVLK